MTTHAGALKLAETAPDRIAVTDDAGRWTYSQLVEDALALASAMAAAGLKPDDVVAFQTPNWAEAAVINLAASMGGFIVTPIVPIYRDAEVLHFLRDSKARLFFHCDVFRGFDYAAMTARLKPSLPDLVAAIPVRAARTADHDYRAFVESGRGRPLVVASPDEGLAKLLLYTSGTTGRAKGVVHSHASLAHVMNHAAGVWEMKTGEAILMPSPVTHISGYTNGLEQPFLAGVHAILMETWDAASAVDLIGRHDIVGTVAATPFLAELIDRAAEQDAAMPSMRFFACGGAAVPVDLIERANARFGSTVAFRAYGSSEAPLVSFGVRDDDPPRMAAVTDGRISDYDVKTISASGADLPAGEEGELLVRGPSLFLGYHDPRDNEAAFDADGFFRTGDLGVVTHDGFLTITGRKKDLIIRGGENISAKEIEDRLHAHPAITSAAVVAMPHDRLGEGICAFLVAAGTDRPSLADIADFVTRAGLAKQKCPERIVWMDDLPQTPSGKVRKDMLRDIASGDT